MYLVECSQLGVGRRQTTRVHISRLCEFVEEIFSLFSWIAWLLCVILAISAFYMAFRTWVYERGASEIRSGFYVWEGSGGLHHIDFQTV